MHAQAVLPEVMRPVIFMVASAFPSARLRALEVRLHLPAMLRSQP